MIRTFLRWQDVRPDELRSHAVVVIDVLRWSSVVVTALANGAEWVEAYETPDEAIARAEALGRGQVLLGGERGNLPLPGFDVGNSPLEYTSERVRGRGVITTTTNGTQGLVAAREADEVFVGCFLNLPAVLGALAGSVQRGLPTALIACGQAGLLAEEDAACAGAIAIALGAHVTDAATEQAIRAWIRGGKDSQRAVSEASHAATLVAAGFGADVRRAGEIGAYDCVPRVTGTRRIEA